MMGGWPKTSLGMKNFPHPMGVEREKKGAVWGGKKKKNELVTGGGVGGKDSAASETIRPTALVIGGPLTSTGSSTRGGNVFGGKR